MELLLVAPLATFLWVFVAKVFGRMAAHEAMDELRSDPADVAAIEATLPKMQVRR